MNLVRTFVIVSFLTFAFAFLVAQIGYADDNSPKIEVFGGYSYVRGEQGVNLHGWNASVAGNITHYFGLVGDVSGHYANDSFLDGNTYTFLGGPQFSFRTTRMTPFAHALFGVTRVSTGLGLFGYNFGASQSEFAMAFGGGLDINLSDRFAIRAIQADYFPVRTGGNLLNSFRLPFSFGSDFVNNFRVGAGIVIKF
jgi:opacity protein-like surface antigen